MGKKWRVKVDDSERREVREGTVTGEGVGRKGKGRERCGRNERFGMRRKGEGTVINNGVRGIKEEQGKKDTWRRTVNRRK